MPTVNIHVLVKVAIQMICLLLMIVFWLHEGGLQVNAVININLLIFIIDMSVASFAWVQRCWYPST